MRTDGELVTETLRGKTTAYDELVRRWAPRVLAVCASRVRRRDIAEELAQESLVRGYSSLSSLADADKFGSWIVSIAYRVSIDWVRSRKRSTASFSELSSDFDQRLVSEQPTHVERLERDDDIDHLLTKLYELPEKYRDIMLLFYYSDSTYGELARVLGISPATVNARLSKARALLRRRGAEEARER